MKRFARAVVGGVLAAGLLAMLPGTVLAAQPSCGDTLTSDTKLTSDLDCSGFGGDALTMGANGVVLDLNGHTIWGPAGDEGYNGVSTDGYNRTVIKKGTIADYTAGIRISGSNRTKVRKVTIDGESGIGKGIYLYNGVANVVKRSSIEDVNIGIDMYGGANQMIAYNMIDAGAEAIYSEYETADWFMYNEVWGTDGFYDDYSNMNWYVGNVTHVSDTGFYLDCDGYGTVYLRGNIANGGDYGFYLYYCYGPGEYGPPGTGSKVINNTANGNASYGFYDDEGTNAVYRGNTANDNLGTGFYFYYPTAYKARHNTALRNTDYGFLIEENYSYYNFVDFSYNKANKNNDGFDAGYGVPGHDNIAQNNDDVDCYNVNCV